MASVIAGSVARGDFNAASDIDVVVISDALPAHPLRRTELLWSVNVARVEPKGYTRAEFLDRLQRGDPLLSEAVARGHVLVDRDGFLSRLRGCAGG